MSWVTTEICWYFHYSCCSKHLTSHACALLIDNVGNYLYMYLNNGSFKSEVDPHQFNLRERKKIFKSWQVCDWLAKWLIVLGFMDLRWPRVYRRSNVGLVHLCYQSTCSINPIFPFQYSGAVGRFVGGSAKKTIRMKTGEDLLQKIWHEIRSNNGIMVLLKLLITKTPITEADAIRALACKVGSSTHCGLVMTYDVIGKGAV